MKHLLLIFPHLRNKNEFGGQRSRHIVSCLSKKGYSTTVIIPAKDSMTSKAKKKLRFMQLWTREQVTADHEIVYVNSTRNVRSSFLMRILYFATTGISVFFAACFVRRVDVVICTSLPVTFLMIGYFLRVIRRVPLIIEVRDIGVGVARELDIVEQTWFSNWVYRIESHVYNNADTVIAVSGGFKDRLIERGVPEDKIHIVKLGFDGYEDDLANAKFKLPFAENLFIVLYSGTLGHVFNIPLVLGAANQLTEHTDILFVFLGGGQNLEYYAGISDAAGLRTIFLGNRPKREVSSYCNRADLCLYPAKQGININSMLGNKIFDYLGNGCACVYAGPGGDVANLINVSGGGVTCGGTPDELSKAILYLYNNPSVRREMGDKAKNFINRHYKSNLMAEKFASLIDEM